MHRIDSCRVCILVAVRLAEQVTDLFQQRDIIGLNFVSHLNREIFELTVDVLGPVGKVARVDLLFGIEIKNPSATRDQKADGWSIAIEACPSQRSFLSKTDHPLSDLEIKSDGTLVTLSSLKLHSVALIKVFDLNARREAAAMKEYIFTTIIWSDESKSLLPDDFFNRSGHDTIPSFLCVGYLKGS